MLKHKMHINGLPWGRYNELRNQHFISLRFWAFGARPEQQICFLLERLGVYVFAQVALLLIHLVAML